jgi:hypothetical protein
MAMESARWWLVIGVDDSLVKVEQSRQSHTFALLGGTLKYLRPNYLNKAGKLPK